MTAAQLAAQERIMHEMREHFNAGLLILSGDVEGNDGGDDIRTTWNGGFATALGLSVLAQKHVLASSNPVPDKGDNA